MNTNVLGVLLLGLDAERKGWLRKRLQGMGVREKVGRVIMGEGVGEGVRARGELLLRVLEEHEEE